MKHYLRIKNAATGYCALLVIHCEFAPARAELRDEQSLSVIPSDPSQSIIPLPSSSKIP
jgi:hypothetical protein